MYDTEYIRELTAARKANEVARALIKDHERTIVAQREQLVKVRCGRDWWKAAAKRWRARARGIALPEVEAVLRHENTLLYVKAEKLEEELIALRMDAQRAELDALRAEAQCAIDAMRDEHAMRVTILHGQIADLDRTIDALRAEVAALRAQVEAKP